MVVRDDASTTDAIIQDILLETLTIAPTTIIEFSTDGTLGGDSDEALPTEQAVKTYVDTIVGSHIVGPGTVTADTIMLFDTTSGLLAKASGIVVDGSDNVTGMNDLTIGGTFTADTFNSPSADMTFNAENSYIFEIEREANTGLFIQSNHANDTAGYGYGLTNIGVTDKVLPTFRMSARKDTTTSWNAFEATVNTDDDAGTVACLVFNASLANGLLATKTPIATRPLFSFRNDGSECAKIAADGTFAVDTISSLSTDTNLTLSGNGTGNVRVDDELSVDSIVSAVGSDLIVDPGGTGGEKAMIIRFARGEAEENPFRIASSDAGDTDGFGLSVTNQTTGATRIGMRLKFFNKTVSGGTNPGCFIDSYAQAADDVTASQAMMTFNAARKEGMVDATSEAITTRDLFSWTNNGTELMMMAVDGALQIDTIKEHAAAAGVAIETVLLKDGLVDGRDIAADGSTLDLLTSLMGQVNITESTLTHTINKIGLFHGIVIENDPGPPVVAETILQGFTRTKGVSTTITSIADATGGFSTITISGQEPENGDYVTIQIGSGSTDYEGVFVVSNSGENVFDIEVTFNATATGFMQRGDKLQATFAGTRDLALMVNMSLSVSGAGDKFDWRIYINGTKLPGAHQSRKFQNADDIGNITVNSGRLAVTSGDQLWIGQKNRTGAGNTQIEDITFLITSVG